VTKPVQGEWQQSDHESLQAAIDRLPLPEQEVRKIDAYWRRLRRQVQDPGHTVGWKY
jgi:hypothetical protein